MVAIGKVMLRAGVVVLMAFGVAASNGHARGGAPASAHERASGGAWVAVQVKRLLSRLGAPTTAVQRRPTC
jgi:hypothetical protein